MKDIFDGQIREEKVASVFIGMVVISIVCIMGAVIFFEAGINSTVNTRTERIFVIGLGLVCGILAILYPVLTVYFARNVKKYPRLAYFFINRKMFK